MCAALGDLFVLFLLSSSRFFLLLQGFRMHQAHSALADAKIIFSITTCDI